MYGLTSEQKVTKKTDWLLVCGLVVVVALAEHVGWLSPVVHGAERAALPAKKLGVQVVLGVTWPFRTFFANYEYAERLQELELAHAKAQARIGQLEQIEQENEDLRRLLSSLPTSDARTFMLAPISSYSAPSVAIGAKHGVQSGSLVMFSETFLGVISDVTEQQARVRLLRQRNGPSVIARTENGIQGILRGDGKTVRLEEVPRTFAIKKGERVVTVGQEGIPAGLFVGIAGSSEAHDASPVQSVPIDQLQSFYDATVVEVW